MIELELDASSRVVYLAAKLSILAQEGVARTEHGQEIKRALDQAYEDLKESHVWN